MQIRRSNDVPWETPRTKHREPGITFRRLFQGKRRSSENYEVSIARTDPDYRAPRHRHNFDQIRVGLSGVFGEGDRLTVGAGQVGYYPEGAYYGIDCKQSEILLFQFAGPSGDEYPGYDDLYEASAEMAKLGTFRDGVFFRHDFDARPAGARRNMDGYEALWQHIVGRALVYPKPRYQSPIIMDCDAFNWVDDAAAVGVRRKLLGTFTQRCVEIQQVDVQPTATVVEAAVGAPKFAFGHSGTGQSGTTAWGPSDVARMESGETLELTAATLLLLTIVSLPKFAGRT